MEKFDQIRLQPTALDISKVTANCMIWRSPRNHRKGGLVVLNGLYRLGSDGADDARFIRWTLRQFQELERVDAIVIDCRDLSYEWGDDLSFEMRQSLDTDEIPLIVVLNEAQQRAFSYAIGPTYHRLDFNAGLVEMDATLRAMKSLL
jgi:hypothetical protein